jgi:hypothetical protein
MVSPPYVDGITDKVSHGIASGMTAGQIAPGRSTIGVSVACPHRWFLGDAAMVTSRDGRRRGGAHRRLHRRGHNQVPQLSASYATRVFPGTAVQGGPAGPARTEDAPDHCPREDGARIMNMKQAAPDYLPASALQPHGSPAHRRRTRLLRS